MNQNTQPSFWSNFVVRFVQIIIVFPFSVLINHYLPNISYIDYEYNFLLAVLIATTFSVLITRFSRKLIVLLFFGLIGMIAFNSTFNGYSTDDIYADYNAMLTNINSNPQRVSFFQPIKGTYFQEQRVVSATHHTHPQVRNFAVQASTAHFSGDYYKKYGKMVRYFSLYKEIREQWRYVNDPRGLDYYSTATESLNLMAGDCDDYSILMAAAVMAVGGEARVIITKEHMYTEVKVGTEEDLDKISYCVRLLFPEETLGKTIYYHQTGSDIWINFDYTDNYPGGPFMNPEILEMISLN